MERHRGTERSAGGRCLAGQTLGSVTADPRRNRTFRGTVVTRPRDRLPQAPATQPPRRDGSRTVSLQLCPSSPAAVVPQTGPASNTLAPAHPLSTNGPATCRLRGRSQAWAVAVALRAVPKTSRAQARMGTTETPGLELRNGQRKPGRRWFPPRRDPGLSSPSGGWFCLRTPSHCRPPRGLRETGHLPRRVTTLVRRGPATPVSRSTPVPHLGVTSRNQRPWRPAVTKSSVSPWCGLPLPPGGPVQEAAIALRVTTAPWLASGFAKRNDSGALD